MSRATPRDVLQSVTDGINAGDLDLLAALYEPDAAFAAQPGILARGPAGVRESLAGFVAAKGKLDLTVTRVLEAGGLALVTTTWTFTAPAPGPGSAPVNLAGRSADVLRRQPDGSWRFVIDNPWGTA